MARIAHPLRERAAAASHRILRGTPPPLFRQPARAVVTVGRPDLSCVDLARADPAAGLEWLRGQL
jgi:hypothetical protein